MSLRILYGVYFTAVAVSLPFFPPYLRALGLSGKQVSLLLAVPPMLHMGAPLLWGWLADRTRRPDLVLRAAICGAFLSYAPIIFVRTMPALLLAYGAHQFFAVPVPGLADALALEQARRGDDYTRIRFWGSVSFTLTCLAIAPVFAARGPRGGDALVPILLAIFLGCASLASFGLRGHVDADRERPHARDVLVLLRDRRFLLILALGPLHWSCLAPYHGFFGILLGDRGHSANVIGAAFVISVIGEMAAFFFFRNLRARLPLPTLMALAFVATIVRWLVVGFAHSAPVLAGMQIFHALTFGVFWGAAMAWLAACVSPKLRATGQTLFTAATYGFGNMIGLFASGAAYDAFFSAAPSFVAAAAFELVPLTLVLALGRKLDPTRARVPARTLSA